MFDGQALDMRFIDHCRVPWRAKRFVIAPIEAGINDNRPRDVWGRIQIVAETFWPHEVLTEDSFVPFHLSLNAFGIWIEEEFCRIAA